MWRPHPSVGLPYCTLFFIIRKYKERLMWRPHPFVGLPYCTLFLTDMGEIWYRFPRNRDQS